MEVTPASHQSDIVDTPQEKCEKFHKGQHLLECDCSPSWMLSDADAEVNEWDEDNLYSSPFNSQ